MNNESLMNTINESKEYQQLLYIKLLNKLI